MSGSPILEKIKAAQAAAQAKAASASTSVAPSAMSTGDSGTGDKPVQATQPSTTIEVKPEIVAAAPVQSATTVKGPISGLLAKINLQGKGQPTLGGALAQSYHKEQGDGSTSAGIGGTGELGKTTVGTLGELLKLASGVVPPDAPSRAQEVITKPGDVVVDPLKDDSEGDDDEDSGSDSTGDNSNNSGASPNVTDSSSGATTSGVSGGISGGETVKKRGRPSREEMAAREAAQKKLFDDAVQAAALKLANTGLGAMDRDQLWESERAKLQSDLDQANVKIANLIRSSYAPIQEGLTLYVDCFPTKGDREVVDFFEWIGPICAQVAQANNVGDWRQINYTSKGLLANAIRETIKEHGTPKGLTVTTYAGGADIALEVLTPIAKRVIKKI